VLSRIQASPLEGVSVMISKSGATLFSLNISDSTAAATSSESTRHLWKLFHSLFHSQQGLQRFQIHASLWKVLR